MAEVAEVMVVVNDMSTRQVVVTGGGRGIGRAIVEALAGDGFDVSFTYRSSADEARDLVAALAGKWPEQNFRSYRSDLASRDEVEALAGEIGRLDALYGFVHNAGMSYDALAAAIDQDRGEAAMQVNFWSMTRLAKAAIRPMMRARTGRVVGIGSINALYGSTGNATYAATKGAMLSYVKTLAVEIARKGVTANYIAPGFVDTEMLAPYGAQREALEKQIPMQRFARPDEVAGVVCYLLAPEAGYMTGNVIALDGGLSASSGIRR